MFTQFGEKGMGCFGYLAPLLLLVLLVGAHDAVGETEEISFPDGVAAGEVCSDGALLWTRTSHPAKLVVEISTDPEFPAEETSRRRVRTREKKGLAACAKVRKLQPATRYYYRFRSKNPPVVSPVGTFRTAPATDAESSLSFVYSGDWDGTRVVGVPVWNDFGIAAQMLADAPDLALMIGDTIVSDPAYADSEARTFEEYCAIYRLNRGYENLRALMAGTGTVWISDDHEYMDNFAGAAPDVEADRFAAALKAFRVNNPVPKWTKKHGFFRTFRWGKHAEFFVLDERTLRTGNVTNDYMADPLPTVPAAIRELAGLPAEVDPDIAAALADPKRSILGKKQKKKFLKALLASDATWKFVINEVAIAEQFFLPYDRWEGYAAERAEILEFISKNEIQNVVFLTTDLHGSQVLDVHLSALADTPVVAREFICGPAADATIKQELDETFGEEAAAQAIGLMEMLNPPHFAEYGSFAYTHVSVDGESGNATFTIKNEQGEVLYSTTLEP